MSSATSAASLCADQVVAYHRDGFVIVRSLFGRDEIATLAAEAERVFAREDLKDSDNIRCRWSNHFETGECRFDCFDPVIDLSPLCARIARDPRLLDAAGALYGQPAFLFKDKLIFKPPGAKGYDLHQDYISWKSFPRSFLTAIVAIDPAGADNGATRVFPGYHTRGCMTPEDGQYHKLPSDAVDQSRAVVMELQPGDVAFFGGFTPHDSGPNRSPEWRRLLYLSYNAAGDGGDQRDQHYAEFKQWLRGRYADYGKVNTFFR